MSAPIGPGDWLECILGETSRCGAAVVVGALYCVELIDTGPLLPCNTCGDPSQGGLQLVGVPMWSGAWCRCGFRPISGGERIMAPPRRVCEPA